MKIFNSPLKISGAAGIFFVIISFFASGINLLPPAYIQDKTEILNWFATNSLWYRSGHFIAGIAFLLFYFPFFAGLYERLKEAEGNPAIWSNVTWSAAIMSPAVGCIAGSFIVSAAFLGQTVSVEVARIALSANFYAYTVSGAFGGVALISASRIILKTDVFKHWLGWTALVVGIAAIASTAAIVENNPQGFFAAVNGVTWILYFFWIVAISIELIRVPQTSESSI